MTAPPGAQPIPDPATSLALESRTEAFLSPRIIMREAAKVVEDLRLSIRGARLRMLVDRFIASGRSDIDFRTWFISYADPTGETAVRNVMRGAGA